MLLFVFLRLSNAFLSHCSYTRSWTPVIPLFRSQNLIYISDLGGVSVNVTMITLYLRIKGNVYCHVYRHCTDIALNARNPNKSIRVRILSRRSQYMFVFTQYSIYILIWTLNYKEFTKEYNNPYTYLLCNTSIPYVSHSIHNVYWHVYWNIRNYATYVYGPVIF